MRLSAFASLKLTMTLLSLITLCILVGAWCPQESQVGFQKVVEQFGEPGAMFLQQLGITDLFHSLFFLGLIALLTINMIVCGAKRVFSRIALLKKSMPFLGETEIKKLAAPKEITLSCTSVQALAHLTGKLKNLGYKVETENNHLKGEYARLSMLSAVVTHVGLLLLLAGITITSWTGFNGFKLLPCGSTFNFADSEHSKLWAGKLPDWSLRIDSTRKEEYATGEPKQWYSNLSVIDRQGKTVKQQEISVNHPLLWSGVDIYQSSWGLSSVVVSFDGRETELPLHPMGETNIAFLPLDDRTIMIFSLREDAGSVKVFAKVPQWEDPKLLSEIKAGSEAHFGKLKVGYVKAIPVTGLQYKSDPGLPVTYCAFIIIILGVLSAAVPHRQIWAIALADVAGSCRLVSGGFSRRDARALSGSLDNLLTDLQKNFPGSEALAGNIGAKDTDQKMSGAKAGVN